MSNPFLRGAVAAGLLAAALSPAAALDNRERARATIAEAKGKLSAVRSADGAATDTAKRAEMALAEAQRQFEKNNNDNAYYAAREGAALAELALAQGEYASLTAPK